MARSTRLSIGIRSAPTTEMYTRCAAPTRDAARTRFLALSSSPLGLPAQCTMVPAPSTAGSIPAPVARAPLGERGGEPAMTAPQPFTRHDVEPQSASVQGAQAEFPPAGGLVSQITP